MFVSVYNSPIQIVPWACVLVECGNLVSFVAILAWFAMHRGEGDGLWGESNVF